MTKSPLVNFKKCSFSCTLCNSMYLQSIVWLSPPLTDQKCRSRLDGTNNLGGHINIQVGELSPPQRTWSPSPYPLYQLLTILFSSGSLSDFSWVSGSSLWGPCPVRCVCQHWGETVLRQCWPVSYLSTLAIWLPLLRGQAKCRCGATLAQAQLLGSSW